MTASSDSGDRHELRKNGIDQIQNKELRDLHDEVSDLRASNDHTHGMIVASLEKYIFAGKVVWALLGLVSGSLFTGVGWLLAEVGSLRKEQAAGHQYDMAMDDSIDDLRQDLRDLRELVQQHQINKREHLKPEHGKNGD